MGLLNATVLALSIIYLLFKTPTMFRNLLPTWFTPEPLEDRPHGAVHVKTNENNPEKVQENAESGEESESNKTPKAQPNHPQVGIPSFTLNDDDDSLKAARLASPTRIPIFPAPNGAQRAQPTSTSGGTKSVNSSSMPPPAKPAVRPVQSNTSNLMPPPAKPSSIGLSSAGGSLRVPSTGPLPNRGPPVNSQQRVYSGLAPSSATAPSNLRGKVILSPGHSAMDWAALTRSGSLAGVSTFQRVTPSTLRRMTGRRGKPVWSSWQGKVYNLTPYIPFHPGGEAEILKAAGRDGSKLFLEVHPWVNWENMLSACLVGVLVPEDHGTGQGSSLEDMD